MASAESLDKLDALLTRADISADPDVASARVALVRSGVFDYLRARSDQARLVLNSPTPTLAAVRAATAPAVDGELDDEIWSTTPPSSAFVTLGNKPNDVGTTFMAAYDATMLYLAVRCEEPDVASMRMDQEGSSPGLATDDAIEFFVDVRGEGNDYVQVILSASGHLWYQWKGRYARSDTPDLAVQGGIHVGDKAWTAELAIPFAKLDVTAPRSGDEYGLNVMRNRYFRDMKWRDERAWLAWSPTFQSGYHVVERFGTLRFE